MKALSIPIVALIFCLISFSSCGNECKKCEDAIIHMCDKIKANGCDPERMENAVARIQDDCNPFNAAVYVGYMAEHCHQYENPKCPLCTDDDADGPLIGALSIGELFISFSGSGLPIPNEEFEIAVTKGEIQKAFIFVEGNFFIDGFNDITYEGEEINFQLVRLSDSEVVANASVNFTFARGNKYSYNRDVVVTYVGGVYGLEFTNW